MGNDLLVPKGMTGEEFESLGIFIRLFTKDTVDADTHNEEIIRAFLMGKKSGGEGSGK